MQYNDPYKITLIRCNWPLHLAKQFLYMTQIYHFLSHAYMGLHTCATEIMTDITILYLFSFQYVVKHESLSSGKSKKWKRITVEQLAWSSAIDWSKDNLFLHDELSNMSQLMRLWYLSDRRPAKAQAPLDGCACAFEEWVYGGWKVPLSHDMAHIVNPLADLAWLHIMSEIVWTPQNTEH